jgi:hypothetical protein
MAGSSHREAWGFNSSKRDCLQVLDGEVPAGLEEGGDACALVAGQMGLCQLAPRRGSTEELSVFLAQYALLVRRLAALRDVMKVCSHLISS